MAADKDQKPSNSIPIRFVDSDDAGVFDDGSAADEDVVDFDSENADLDMIMDDPISPRPESEVDDSRSDSAGGPALAELIASRAELKRLQTALAEAQDALARRQADFENYRKRVERERGETHDRIVAEVARKLLPVIDNLGRALDSERTIEARESKEFRHFLHGVELISKQLNEVLESFGIQPIAAVGEPFDPHVHEAVVTEASDDYEPDTVMEEITRGYRIGDRLLRPAMVKVATRKNED
jgi:molecular chaperone GrpE